MRKQYKAPQIGPVIHRAGVSAMNAGPISMASVESGEGTFSVELDNSTGSQAKTYVIGDASGVAEASSSETWENPDGGSITPAVLNASFGDSPCVIGEITYIVKNDKSQFSQSLRHVRGSRNGNFVPNNINVARFQSSADQNTLVRTLKFAPDNAPVLSSNRGLAITVKAGEVVNLEFTQAIVAQG